MKRFILGFLFFCCYGCSNQILHSDERLNSYVEPSLIALEGITFAYYDREDFYTPLVSGDLNSRRLVLRSFLPVINYINLILADEKNSRHSLFLTSLNTIKSCVDKVKLQNGLEGNFFLDYPVVSYNRYDNLQARVDHHQVSLCQGALVSLVFFNQEQEKRHIAEFFQTYYAKKFKAYWALDIKELNSDEIYELVTRTYTQRINNELLPYFRQQKEIFIAECVKNHPEIADDCNVSYDDWDIKPFN